MSRLVRSPAAPKIAMVAGEGRWSGKHFAIVAASVAIVVIGLLSSWGDVVGRLLRRDEGALASRSMSALLTIFQPTRSAPTAARSNSEATLSCAAFHRIKHFPPQRLAQRSISQ